jgi:putative Mg2+ transporter-C (MgtC) family protein
MTMPLHAGWQDIGVRLVVTMIAGAVIGYNREARGHAAGLRTTILVGLAAAVAMIQANILLPVGGKAADSFGVMDLMRLPLGILTGVGFIGGGAILRRGDLVTGVTTAATLWVMTVIGLCFGGGQLVLGGAATVLAAATLWLQKEVDHRTPRDRHAILVLAADPGFTALTTLDATIAPLGYRASFRRQTAATGTEPARLWFEVHWRGADAAGPPLDLLTRVGEAYALLSFELTSEAGT